MKNSTLSKGKLDCCGHPRHEGMLEPKAEPRAKDKKKKPGSPKRKLRQRPRFEKELKE